MANPITSSFRPSCVVFTSVAMITPHLSVLRKPAVAALVPQLGKRLVGLPRRKLQSDRFIVGAKARGIVALQVRGQLIGLESKRETGSVVGAEKLVFRAFGDQGERCVVLAHRKGLSGRT